MAAGGGYTVMAWLPAGAAGRRDVVCCYDATSALKMRFFQLESDMEMHPIIFIVRARYYGG